MIVTPQYFVNAFKQKSVISRLDAISHGGTMDILSLKTLKEIHIPLPPLNTQRAIVAEIEAEQTLVDANKQLIARFEAKIKATIDRVWGGSETT